MLLDLVFRHLSRLVNLKRDEAKLLRAHHRYAGLRSIFDVVTLRLVVGYRRIECHRTLLSWGSTAFTQTLLLVVVVYIRTLSHRTEALAIEHRKSRAAVPRRGVRWRPDLTDNRIVLPSRTKAYTANECFSAGHPSKYARRAQPGNFRETPSTYSGE